MLDPADILIDVHPVFRICHIDRRFCIGRSETREIPRAVNESIHRIRLALRRATAIRAGAIAPCRVTIKRIAGCVEGYIIRQLDRQVLFLFGNHAAIRAMHNRNRATPIALTRQAPIAQAVFGDALADAVLFAEGDRGVDRFIASLPLLTREPAVEKTFSVFAGT